MRPLPRALVAFVVVALVAGGLLGAAVVGGFFKPGSSASLSPTQVGVVPTPVPSGTIESPPPSSFSPSPEVSPSPTPVPTPVTVPGPLDGLPITPAQAKLHPIAVMIDDLSPARPQSGFSYASIVWQAPAEGGIPRYMMIFQENTPKDVGPVRSSRYYYITWAAEWDALYVHAGGSPQALETLRAQGNGQLVYNADEFAWGGYFRRITTNFAPHNLYTTGKQLRTLADRRKATAAPGAPVWKFAPDAPLETRPVGGTISVTYPGNPISYKYDRFTNTYVRYVGGGKRQVDPSSNQVVAPKNVVVMLMQFGPLNDGHPKKNRLEATVVGKGKAWIATNGHTIVGTWRKKSLKAPTKFYDAAGHEVTLTAGQTFVQVMKTSDIVVVKDGKVPPPPAPSPSPSGLDGSPGISPSPSPSALRGRIGERIA